VPVGATRQTFRAGSGAGVDASGAQLGRADLPDLGLPYSLIWCGRLAAVGQQRIWAARAPGSTNVPCLLIASTGWRAATGNGIADSLVIPQAGAPVLVVGEFTDTARIEINGHRDGGSAITASPRTNGSTLGGAPADPGTLPSTARTWLAGIVPALLSDDDLALLLAWAVTRHGVGVDPALRPPSADLPNNPDAEPPDDPGGGPGDGPGDG